MQSPVVNGTYAAADGAVAPGAAGNDVATPRVAANNHRRDELKARAANACADSCLEACDVAKAATVKAQAAAARCVLARDDAGTAALLVRKAPICSVAHKEARRAYRESADVLKEARKDAVAAGLAARRAAVSCAAASRRAVSAAAGAREIANCCVTAGGVRVVAAAAAAREAADRCVAATAAAIVADAATAAAIVADAADGDSLPAVPRADRAASEARKAAESCDEALSDAGADKDFLDKMRGWLMAVTTLFVGIAFQAILHPPVGMSSCDHCYKSGGKTATASIETACLYLAFNTITMATAITLLVMLLAMKKTMSSIVTLRFIKSLLSGLAVTVACSFITATSGGQRVQLFTLLVFGTYVFVVSLHPILRFYFRL
ncbi:uncharacterized protein [Lolium perenne]|uniref:uncharacterized protein n=1 Tax=Lolium perenne TaxID=4522 RepID=UPI0021EABB2B|nr:uncharacterized protein LOC127325547 [Lolium perenne]